MEFVAMFAILLVALAFSILLGRAALGLLLWSMGLGTVRQSAPVRVQA